CHDHVLFASAVIQPAFAIDFSEVSSAQPLTTLAGDTLAPDQDFAIRRDHHILTGHDLSQRSALCAEWMIDGDDRTGFRQTITLNHCVPELSPKLFQLGIDARAAHDKCPELPTEGRVDFSIAPPTRDYAEPALCRGSRSNLESALDLMLERFKNARDRND